MRTVAAVLLLVAALSLVALPCWAESAVKVTGGVAWLRTEGGVEHTCWAEFSAHADAADRPAKGWVRYREDSGNYFVVDVMCVNHYEQHAVIAGPIVKTNSDEWQDRWLQIWVFDGGTPGSEGDRVGGEMYDRDPGCDMTVQPPEWWDVTNGNLVVHF